MPGISVSKICVPFGGGGIDWSSYWTNRHPELATYQTGLTTPLSEAQIIRLGEFIEAVKTGLSITNLSDAFDAMYILAGETAESSVKNLVKNAHHAVATNSPTFTQFEGFTGDAISRYLNLQYNPLTQGSRYTLNSASYGIYYRQKLTSGSYDGCSSASLLRSDTGVGWLNNSPSGDLACGASPGFLVIDRESNILSKAYKNGSNVDSSNVASTAVPNAGWNLLCYGVTYNNSQVSFAMIGKHLTAPEILSITNAIETYMDGNGKGVIA